MPSIGEYLFLFQNIAVWAILIVAFFAYGILLEFSFFKSRCEHWFESTAMWIPTIQKLLACLPLLGLLGTITGLMATFRTISREYTLSINEFLTGGIAEAMLTTQLGLVLVVPGLVLLSMLQNKRDAWEVAASYEVKLRAKN